MTHRRRKRLIAGNWKMHGLRADLAEVGESARGLRDRQDRLSASGVTAALCVPFTLISAAAEAIRETPLAIGGQDCHPEPSGAHTGDVSAEMLADAGASMVILGHSERRRDHRETNAIIRAKLAAARRAGLLAIVCVGETEPERDAGAAVQVVSRQLRESLDDNVDASNTVVAYEPVWAIGTGRTPTAAQIAEMHGALRALLKDRFDEEGEKVRILYGGSMKPENARMILAVDDVDGGLIGGASLKAESFLAIVDAAL
ncbi:MAG: triose-phosphate isomerase [Alphaproteobacteria bacterium]|nr:MAG: triose-phosphate isomerase [Alphaproteobacteria bacterium]